MSTLYNIPGSKEDPLIDKNFVQNYLEPDIKAGFDKLKTEIIQELTQTFTSALKQQSTEIEKKITETVEQAKKEVQIKASDTEPKNVEPNTVWVNKGKNLVMYRTEEDKEETGPEEARWEAIGAVWQ